jgi:hypothetical protein
MNAPIRAAMLTVLPALLLLGGVSYAAPPARPVPPAATPKGAPPSPPAPSVVKPAPRMKLVSELSMKGAATTPGEKRAYEAVLVSKASGAPLANKKVSFTLEGKNGSKVPGGVIAMGDATTDDQGHAKVELKTPDLAQASYALKASFAGDDENGGDKAEASLFVAKAATKIVLTDAVSGALDAHGSNQSSIVTMIFWLERKSDQAALAKPLKLYVNGEEVVLYTTQQSYQYALTPLDAKSWHVKVVFEGDDSALATAAERTYKRPAK